MSVVAPERTPDRVTYGEWEPIHGPERVRQVATDWTLFSVREYTEVRDKPVTGWQRKRLEVWNTPEGKVGRWVWEYSNRDMLPASEPLPSKEP